MQAQGKQGLKVPVVPRRIEISDGHQRARFVSQLGVDRL
jgi:ParB-like chromosome segregation protein Spo0J